MSIIDSHRLTKPEFLSEHELCQILKNVSSTSVNLTLKYIFYMYFFYII